MDKTLVERLKHFECNQLDLSDRYGAEVLHEAVARIAELEAQLAEIDNFVPKYSVITDPSQFRPGTEFVEKILADRVARQLAEREVEALEAYYKGGRANP